ncbi:HNH endonuclease [Stenotrophomonas muris]|uniref:HNH endonuclease n=1 Tax=Stenotrophomonas muris TaxID=2963283 RepID=UPI000259BE66|nr:hypothetical protein [Stenotrophomonas muris]CCH12411.1 hypothetical protein SMD_1866 [Stenotrophomonas maltophilia D457]
MLFPYTYVPHQMERMHAFIDFIFHEVWCKAPAGGDYSLDLFVANPELHEVMTAFHYDDSKGAEFFSSHVERIYGLFSALSETQITQFREWHRGNNDLERVCANDPVVQLARYSDIAANHKDLAVQLGAFFKGLYSQSLLGLAALRAKIGDIDSHYQAFMQVNRVGKCPFCGLNDLLGEFHSKREAYDHYLPKALYPFNSINFRNLVPSCHHCNSSYKTSKNPAHKFKDPTRAVERRAFFYPYRLAAQPIELQVTLLNSDIAKLTPSDISLQFGPSDVAEEIDAWKDVYGIEERYKAKLCGENDGKYWLIQVLDECSAYDKNPVDILTMRARQTLSRPFADCNFLRMPFLDACQQIGVL